MLVTWGLGNPIGLLQVTSVIEGIDIDVDDEAIDVVVDDDELVIIVEPELFDSWVDEPASGTIVPVEGDTEIEVCA